jgi:two-component system phosphate regulon sensor histidine kinase PhoR
LKPYLYSIKTLTEFGIDKESLLKDLQVNNYHQQELQLSDRDFAVIFTPYGEGYSTIVCVFNDVTELKQLDRMKTDLLRTVSHEIKTPLTIIQSYCDLGLEMQDGKVALEYLEKISQNTEYLTELVTDYLDLNKLEANLVQLKLEPININDLLQGVLYEMQTLADQKCIELLLNTEQDANYVVLADKARIKQVFVNLISNAVKYSETNKTVNIFVKKLSEMIKISIKDEGYGIELDEIAMIFDKFYRIRSDQTENITGTGLGLAIVKKIIELHQGDIKVSSKPGEGTQFDIYLQRPQTEENIDEHIFD